jgi:UPF0755 protein
MFRALMFLVIIGGIVVGGVSELLRNEVRRSVDPNDDTAVEFVIEPDQSAADIAANLREQDLIRQPLLFQFMVRQQGVGQKLQAGPYQLSKSMTMGQIITALQTAPSFEEKTVTIIPGMRLEEVAKVMVDAGLAESAEDFLTVARDAAPFKANHALLESIPEGQGLEGYLFPDTYRIESTSAISETIDRILNDGFDTNYKSFESEVIAEGPDGGELTVHQIVTMASIVQREAANNEEMPHLSYIFWNRLKPENAGEVNGRLQADPTLQYALGTEENWWPKLDTLTVDEINNNTSPYNTRSVQGLPPGPIANPSLFALRAAARPGPLRPDGSEGENDLYFVAKCDGGQHEFAATYDEFQTLGGADGSCSQ